MIRKRRSRLLPEEDILDEPDDDDGFDTSLPGDLWFRSVDRDSPASRP
jgi:hypothetical protein